MEENTREEQILPYDETPDPQWKKVVEKWPWKIVSRTPEYTVKCIEGFCPRCNHKMSVQVKEGTGRFFMTPDHFYIIAICNCSVAHPPSEQGKGCGRCAKISTL